MIPDIQATLSAMPREDVERFALDLLREASALRESLSRARAEAERLKRAPAPDYDCDDEEEDLVDRVEASTWERHR